MLLFCSLLYKLDNTHIILTGSALFFLFSVREVFISSINLVYKCSISKISAYTILHNLICFNARWPKIFKEVMFHCITLRLLILDYEWLWRNLMLHFISFPIFSFIIVCSLYSQIFLMYIVFLLFS
jgi:hypothetical protein